MKITTWIEINDSRPAAIEIALPHGLSTGRHRVTVEIDEASEPVQEFAHPSTELGINWSADTPHVHDPSTFGTVRKPNPDEIPQ